MRASEPRRALITGGSGGIGRGIAEALAGEGYDLIISGRKPEAGMYAFLEKLENSGSGKALYIRGDIAEKETRVRLVEAASEGAGRLDLLVNNAGMMSEGRKDILDLDEQDMRRLLDVNLIAPFALTRDLVPCLRNAWTRSYIVNISSINAYTASVNRADYCVGKAGLSMLTRLFAVRLAGMNIGVFEIRPGIIQTPMTEPVSDTYDTLIAEGLLPIARQGTPEDIAASIIAIVSGAFPYSTGQVIDADGGFHIRRL